MVNTAVLEWVCRFFRCKCKEEKVPTLTEKLAMDFEKKFGMYVEFGLDTREHLEKIKSYYVWKKINYPDQIFDL